MRETLHPDNTVIFCCESMRLHLDAAQKTAGTTFPVMEFEWGLHKEPALLREEIRERFSALSPQVTHVLSALGFCGGWDGLTVDRTLVLPNLDDCVTMLLAVDDCQCGNRKKAGCFYFHEADVGVSSLCGFLREIQRKYGTEIGTAIFGSMTGSYTESAIIDTGVYDCYDEAFVEEVQKNADLIRCSLDYAEGSNRVLTKLVSGCWDQQFLVYHAGETVREADFSLGDEEGVRRPY